MGRQVFLREVKSLINHIKMPLQVSPIHMHWSWCLHLLFIEVCQKLPLCFSFYSNYTIRWWWERSKSLQTISFSFKSAIWILVNRLRNTVSFSYANGFMMLQTELTSKRRTFCKICEPCSCQQARTTGIQTCSKR